MTKVLFVSGEDDYGALTYDQFHDKQSVVKMCEERNEKEGKNGYELEFNTPDGGQFFAKLIEFKDIDPEFIKFLKEDIQDYDDSKHKNFYIITGGRK